MPIVDRREFLEMLASIAAGNTLLPALAAKDHKAGQLIPGKYEPGRIENEYSLFLPGEREALQRPPRISSVTADEVSVITDAGSSRIQPGDQIDGWRLLAMVTLNNKVTAVFEKSVTHRGVLAFVTESDGVMASIPKKIGQLSCIRPQIGR